MHRGFSLGLVAIGGLAFGGLAMAGVAVGWASSGGLAIGYLANGGCGVAWHAAQGGTAMAFQYALGGSAYAQHANDPVAREAIASMGFFQHSASLFSHPVWIGMAWIPLLLVLWRSLRARRALQSFDRR